MDMIISVVPKKQQLDHLLPAALALIGAGILKFFIDPDGKKLPVRAGGGRGQFTCYIPHGGYAKAGLIFAGFEIPTATGPTHDPGKNDVVTLTVIPALPDGIDNDHYPAIGAAEFGMTAAKALCGAFVTRTIGPNDDPYIGNDPGTKMQVCCNRVDVQRVIDGFAYSRFTATPDPVAKTDPVPET